MFSEKNIKCHQVYEGTKDQLLTDKAAIRNWKWKKTNLSTAWIDVQKLYYNVSCLMTIKTHKLIGDSSIIVKFIKSTMNGWRITLILVITYSESTALLWEILASVLVIFEFYSFSHSIDISFEENKTRLLSRRRQEQVPLFTLHKRFKVSWH